MKRILMIAVPGLLVAVGAWAWLYSRGDCGKRRMDIGVRDISASAAKWDDAFKLAAASSRMTIGPNIGKLQEVRREVEQRDLPPCLARPRMLLVDRMNLTIEYLTRFMGGTDESSSEMTGLAARIKSAANDFDGEFRSATACKVAAWNPECR